MPAKNVLKEYCAESFYHLYNRGVEKRLIFVDGRDYAVFEKNLSLYLTRVGGESSKVSPSQVLKNYADEIDLISYCLMPNHFHLLVKQHPNQGINYFMRSLMTKYSVYFNKRYKRVGSLFGGPYRAVKIESEEQLIYLTAYIHRNLLSDRPTEREIKRLRLYPYSSYHDYLGIGKRPWVKSDIVLEAFSRLDNRFGYASFVEAVEGLEESPLRGMFEGKGRESEGG